MVTQKTPGVWEDIPVGSKIRAERKGTVIIGNLIKVTEVNRNKYMDVDAFPPFTTRLSAKDQWEVTYESTSAGDVIRSAPIGTVWGVPMTFYPRIVRISDEYVSRQHERSERPIILPITNFDAWDADTIRVEDPAYLADLVKVG